MFGEGSSDGRGQEDFTGRAHMGEGERGKVTVTTVTTRRIAQALRMTLAELFTGLEQDQRRDE